MIFISFQPEISFNSVKVAYKTNLNEAKTNKNIYFYPELTIFKQT